MESIMIAINFILTLPQGIMTYIFLTRAIEVKNKKIAVVVYYIIPMMLFLLNLTIEDGPSGIVSLLVFIIMIFSPLLFSGDKAVWLA